MISEQFANSQIKTLETQLAVIDRFQASDYGALAKTVSSPDENGANGSANGAGTAAPAAGDAPAVEDPAPSA